MLNHYEIDKFLANVAKAQDDLELRRIFETYNAEYDLNVPLDPFSDEYRLFQLNLYESLAKRKYSPQNEITNFDVDAAAVSPFPYCHGSCETVGDQLMGIGFLIKTLALQKGAQILEFGPGWGNTTIALAQMGFEITAIDIEENFCRLIEKRASLEHVDINVVNSDFNYIRYLDKKFDAILFFECFHHADDHLAIISNFDRVLKPGGRVYFAAEPITSDFPLPWGLRMDGQSLWAIRKNGWLELGYNYAYFERAMDRYGWSSTIKEGSDGPLSNVIVAQRKSEFGGTFTGITSGLKTQVGEIKTSGQVLTTGTAGFLIYGPYIMLPKGLWRATFCLSDVSNRSGIVVLDIYSSTENRCLITRKINIEEEYTDIYIEFLLETNTDGIEARMYVDKNTFIEFLLLKIESM